MNINFDTECNFNKPDSSAKLETAWDGLASAAYSPDMRGSKGAAKYDTSSGHLPQPIIIEDNRKEVSTMPVPDKETYPSWTQSDKIRVPGLDMVEEPPKLLPSESSIRYDGLRNRDRISNYYDNAIGMVTDYDRRRASEIMDGKLDHWREPSERRILRDMEDHILRGDLNGLRRDLSRISPNMLESVIDELNHQFERSNSGLHIKLSDDGKVVIYKDGANHALEIDSHNGKARVGLLDTRSDGTVAILPGAVLNPRLRDVVNDLADTAVRNINAERPYWGQGYGGYGGMLPRPYRPSDEVPAYHPRHPHRPWNAPGSGIHILPEIPSCRPGIDPRRPSVWFEPTAPCERPNIGITWGRHRPWGGSIHLPVEPLYRMDGEPAPFGTTIFKHRSNPYDYHQIQKDFRPHRN